MSADIDLTINSLEDAGIVEVENWMCEDTADNRAILRKLSRRYKIETGAEGEPTGYLDVESNDEVRDRHKTFHEKKKDFLVDPKNAWSDFLPPPEAPLDAKMPYWVRKIGYDWAMMQATGTPEHLLPILPERCSHVRLDGTRCWQWALTDAPMRCPWHSPAGMKKTRNWIELAKMRVLEATPGAADVLASLLDAQSESVRLKASTEILDRAGIRGGFEVDARIEVSEKDPANVVRDRLKVLAARVVEETVIDVEEVEDEEKLSGETRELH